MLSQFITNFHALFVWLNRDVLIAKLCAEVDAVADPASALTAEQRRKENIRLDAEILRIEREEETLIVAAANEGTFITRRADADPRAVLELDDNVPGLVTE